MKITYTDNKDGTFTGRARQWVKMPDGTRKQLVMPRMKDHSKLAVRQLATDWERAGGWEKLTARLTPLVPVETNGAFLETWFERKLIRWADKTGETNTYNFNKHVRANTGWMALPLASVDLNAVLKFLDEIKGSPNTKHKVKALIAGAYNDAVRYAKLSVNPFSLLAPHEKPKKSKSRIVSLSPDDEVQIVRCAQNSPFWQAIVYLGLDGSLGPAEMLGLMVDDLEPKTRHINIRRNVTAVQGAKAKPGPTKAESRYRRLQVSEDTFGALERLLAAQGDLNGYVFHNRGELWRYEDLRSAWKSFLKKAGVTHTGIYTLRHTCATNLLRAGMPIAAVSRRLGHSDINTTLRNYVHAMPNEADAGAEYFTRRMASVGPLVTEVVTI